jgi:hypothetical protein
MKKWFLVVVLYTLLLFGAVLKFTDHSLIETYENAYVYKFNRLYLNAEFPPKTNLEVTRAGEGSGLILYSRKSNENGIFLSENITLLDRIYYYPLTDLYFYIAKEFRLQGNLSFIGYLIFIYSFIAYFILRIEND